MRREGTFIHPNSQLPCSGRVVYFFLLLLLSSCTKLNMNPFLAIQQLKICFLLFGICSDSLQYLIMSNQPTTKRTTTGWNTQITKQHNKAPLKGTASRGLNKKDKPACVLYWNSFVQRKCAFTSHSFYANSIGILHSRHTRGVLGVGGRSTGFMGYT